MATDAGTSSQSSTTRKVLVRIGANSRVVTLESDADGGDCGEQYQQETEESKLWIGCSLCEAWYHAVCQGLSSASVPSEDEDYICLKCRM